MPYADPERQREYQRQRVAETRRAWLDGCCCVDCGSDQRLELDHRDPAQKVDHRIWSWAPERLAAEFAKCDIRCADCHRARHAHQRMRHGGTSRYRAGCRCSLCRAAKRDANARYRAQRRGRESNAHARLCRPLPNHSATSPWSTANSNEETTSVSGEGVLLMATRRSGAVVEAEPVLVAHDGSAVTLTLEDGHVLTLDERELLSTLRAA